MSTSSFHKLLLRQIEKHIPDFEKVRDLIEPFLNAVNTTYGHYESDRVLLERSMDLSSKELTSANEKLSQESENQKIILRKLKESVLALNQLEHNEDISSLNENNIVMLADIIRDQITRRRQTEANLVALLDNTNDSIWSIDKDFKILSFNSSFKNKIKSSFSCEPQIEMNIDEIYGIGSIETKIWKAYLFRALSGERFSHDRKIQVGNETIYLEISLNPIVSGEDVVGVTIFEKDITQRKKSEEEIINARMVAEAANEAKTEFLANMSHELRTPLNAIIGYSELIREEDGGQSGQDAHKITLAGKHLLEIINGILDFSKMEANKIEIYLEKISVSGLIENLNMIIGYLVTKNNNKYECILNNKTNIIQADVSKTTQILFNFLSNASKFTTNGKVSLIIEDYELEGVPGLKFNVQDTGIGIPEDKMNKLFKPFSQVDSSTTRKYGGTGLGLVLSKKFAEIIGGNVSCSSVMGKGSLFSLWIPTKIDQP
ncbi:MAG: PAS domain S-box protein [Oligoflexales bacterium]|nr:PAS domain S-box protein [Oligoflexales bacterium]